MARMIVDGPAKSLLIIKQRFRSIGVTFTMESDSLPEQAPIPAAEIAEPSLMEASVEETPPAPKSKAPEPKKKKA